LLRDVKPFVKYPAFLGSRKAVDSEVFEESSAKDQKEMILRVIGDRAPS